MSSQPPWSEEAPPWEVDDSQIPGLQNAVKGAVQRSEAKPFDWSSIMRPGIRAGEMAAAVGIPAAGLAIAGPTAFAAGALGAWGGGKVGRELGGSAGRLVGYPKEGSNIGELIGTLGGGAVGGASGSQALSVLGKLTPHSRAGILAKLLAGAEDAAPKAAATAVPAASAASNPLEDTIQALMRGESSMGKMGREAAEKLALAIEQKAGRAVPNIPREVANATTAARVGKAVSPLQGPRIQRGAERVGKTVGMTKEQVRQQAGPVLNEAVGEASPILPRIISNDIAEAIKKLPRGEARDAYVRAARDAKTMPQVELIRRVLESQGLLVPIAAGVAGSQMGGGDGW